MNPYVELRNSADGVLASDNDNGPDTDSFISYFVIPSSGTYYARLGKDSASTVAGAYALHVDVARGIDLETDAEYANDGIGSADNLTLGQGDLGQIVGTVSGSVIAAQGAG